MERLFEALFKFRPLLFAEGDPAGTVVVEARDSLELFEAVDFDDAFRVAPGVDVTWSPAGHILGAAAVELRLQEGLIDTDPCRAAVDNYANGGPVRFTKSCDAENLSK